MEFGGMGCRGGGCRIRNAAEEGMVDGMGVRRKMGDGMGVWCRILCEWRVGEERRKEERRKGARGGVDDRNEKDCTSDNLID